MQVAAEGRPVEAGTALKGIELEVDKIANSADESLETEKHLVDPSKEEENTEEASWNTEEDVELQLRQPVHKAEVQSINSQVHRNTIVAKVRAAYPILLAG